MNEKRIADYLVRTDRWYLKTHEWAQEQDDGSWLIGISDYAQKMLREISYVQFEETGEEFAKDEVIAVVEAIKAVGDIYAPFDCVLLENNDKLEDEPDIITNSPYNEGYLVRVKPTSDDRGSLITADEYIAVIEEELKDL